MNFGEAESGSNYYKNIVLPLLLNWLLAFTSFEIICNNNCYLNCTAINVQTLQNAAFKLMAMVSRLTIFWPSWTLYAFSWPLPKNYGWSKIGQKDKKGS